MDQTEAHDHSWAQRALIAAVAAAAVAAVFLVFWYGMHILLLTFAGVLLSLLLSGLSQLLSNRTKLGYRACFAVVLVVIAGLFAGLVWAFASRIAGEADRLTQEFPSAVRQMAAPLMQYEWIRRLFSEMPDASQLLQDRPELLTRASGFLSSTINAAFAFFLVLLVAVYVGFDPDLYRRGVLWLIPPKNRPRVGEVLRRVAQTLRWWLVAHFSAMTVVGVLTGLGLWALGVPLAFLLAVIAALLTFIPNIGPVLSAVPAVVIALSQDPQTALWVVLLYVGVQLVESNFLTPVFELEAVSLPPALTISVQLLLGTLAGVVGLVVASPLTATTTVLVKSFYIEDRLGESVSGD